MRQPFRVIYRLDDQKHVETFWNLGQALAKAEFISRVEGCPVRIKHGQRSPTRRARIPAR